MSTWICDGTLDDGTEYLEGGGKHSPQENEGTECIFCGLSLKEKMGSNHDNNGSINPISSTEFPEHSTINTVIPKKTTPKKQGNNYNWIIILLFLIGLFSLLGFVGGKLLVSGGFLGGNGVPHYPDENTEETPTNITTDTSPIPSLTVPSTPPIVKLIPYQNPKHGISINYPDNWEIQEQLMITTGELVTFFSPQTNSLNNVREKVIISVVDLSHNPRPISLNEYSEIMLKQIGETTHNKSIKPTPTTLSKRKAKTMTYSSILEENNVQIKETWTLYNNRAYIITHIVNKNTVSEWEATVNNMVKSFEIKQQ